MGHRARPARDANGEAAAATAGRDTETSAKKNPQRSTEEPPPRRPESPARLLQVRKQLEQRIGQLVMLMMRSAKYRHFSLSDLNDVVVQPLLRDRISIASAKGESDTSEQHSVLGAAVWATVNEPTDFKIREQIKGGLFPIRLSPEERSSGEILWLLDIIAPDKKAATAVLLNFGKIAGDRPVRIHPAAAASADSGVVKRLQQSEPAK